MSSLTEGEARGLFAALQAASTAFLGALGIPLRPVGKTRPWHDGVGPVGLGLHYTGGADGVATCRWFNDSSYGNDDSSAHCVVFDRAPDAQADLWARQEAAAVFPVPTILLADPAAATWHANWGNSRLFGIENRNVGYSKPNVLGKLGKFGVPWKDRIYEPFTREQIAANVLIGRLWRAIRGGAFDPFWICGHSQIWATKSDPGPLYPSMAEMRALIWSDDPLEAFPVIGRYPPGAVLGKAQTVTQALPAWEAPRRDPPRTVPVWHADPRALPIPDASDRLGVVHSLQRLGWPVALDTPTATIREAVVCFQRSTLAYQSEAADRVLAVDGVAGPKTRGALARRLQELRLPPV